MIQTKVKFQTYPAYKDSGVEWLGKIPEGWEVLKIKNISGINKTSLSESCKGDFEFGYVDIGNVTYEEGIIGTEKFIFRNAPSRARRIAKPNDIVISTVRTYLKAIDFIDTEKSQYIYSTGFAVLEPINYKVVPQFLGSFVKSSVFTNQVDMASKGMSYPAINSTDLSNLFVCLPPLPEQTAIAHFLDKKTAKIDQAIAQKEQLIALLKERKQILIQQAVTKGLDPNVRMKDSGVEWIGEVPEGWEVKKLKFIVKRSFSGGTPSTDKLEYWDGGIPWISSVDVKTNFLKSTTREISANGLLNSSSNIAPKGSIVFVTRSGILQHTFALSILEREMAINQDIKCLIISKSIFSSYLQKLIQGNNSKILVEVRQQAATVESINMDAFPAAKEQTAITNFIETQSAKMDQAIGLQQTQINKLKEYKATLIDSAVTGKIKVV